MPISDWANVDIIDATPRGYTIGHDGPKGSAERALERFANEVEGFDDLVSEHDGHDCPCYPMSDMFSAFNRDPRSWQAWRQLDEFVTHLSGFDSFEAWDWEWQR